MGYWVLGFEKATVMINQWPNNIGLRVLLGFSMSIELVVYELFPYGAKSITGQPSEKPQCPD